MVSNAKAFLGIKRVITELKRGEGDIHQEDNHPEPVCTYNVSTMTEDSS